jgi:hypothetical protein
VLEPIRFPLTHGTPYSGGVLRKAVPEIYHPCNESRGRHISATATEAGAATARLPRWRIPRARRPLTRLRCAPALRAVPSRAVGPPCGAAIFGPREKTMIEVYGTTLACIGEIRRGMLVRRLAGFHVVVDIRTIEEDAVRLCLDDGSTITLGAEGLVEIARSPTRTLSFPRRSLGTRCATLLHPGHSPGAATSSRYSAA